MTAAQRRLDALMSRIEQAGYATNHLDLFAMLDSIERTHDGQVEAVDEFTFLGLIVGHEIADQTTVPCPSWCRYESGHRFELTTDDGAQLRYHAEAVAHGVEDADRNEELYLAITSQDVRLDGDDASVVRGPATVTLMVDGDFTAVDARRLAAALAAAADLVDGVNQ